VDSWLADRIRGTMLCKDLDAFGLYLHEELPNSSK
jgi:hypothetical protein